MSASKPFVIVILTVVLVFMNTTGFSKKQQHNKGEFLGASFNTIDADKDGKISRDEYLKIHEERFNKFDGNGDGYLTEEEVKVTDTRKSKKSKRKTAQKGKMRFSVIDTDDDRKISKEEWITANPERPEAAQMFDQIDTDKDGYWAKKEFKDFKKQSKEKSKKNPQNDD
jgi:Ca2+-binding EF-hand superfamily protein